MGGNGHLGPKKTRASLGWPEMKRRRRKSRRRKRRLARSEEECGGQAVFLAVRIWRWTDRMRIPQVTSVCRC